MQAYNFKLNTSNKKDWYKSLHELEPLPVEEIEEVPVDFPFSVEYIQGSPQEGII